MGNIVTTLKRFLSNKNTVTILGVILGLIVLFVGYNYRINAAVDTIMIPYAKRTISSTQEITSDAVGTMEVLRATVSSNKNIISDINRVVSSAERYCVSETSSVPEGGFFYTEQVKSCNAVKSDALDRMPDGLRAVSIPVTLQSTYGNSMYPGDYIDLYAKMYSDSGLLMIQKLVTKLQILDVRDSNSRSLVYDPSSSGIPAILLFAVPMDLFDFLLKAEQLPDNIVELFPVPGNAEYSAEVGETKVTNNQVKDLILEYTISIGSDEESD